MCVCICSCIPIHMWSAKIIKRIICHLTMFVRWALLISDGHLFLFLAVSVFDVVLCTFVSSVYIWRSVAPVQLNLIALNASLTIIIIIINVNITIVIIIR